MTSTLFFSFFFSIFKREEGLIMYCIYYTYSLVPSSAWRLPLMEVAHVPDCQRRTKLCAHDLRSTRRRTRKNWDGSVDWPKKKKEMNQRFTWCHTCKANHITWQLALCLGRATFPFCKIRFSSPSEEIRKIQTEFYQWK